MSECKACNYKEGWDTEKFIQIYPSHGFAFETDCGESCGVKLYSCPKCGTVIMSKWECDNEK